MSSYLFLSIVNGGGEYTEILWNKKVMHMGITKQTSGI
jgi:hypothetical protein